MRAGGAGTRDASRVTRSCVVVGTFMRLALSVASMSQVLKRHAWWHCQSSTSAHWIQLLCEGWFVLRSGVVSLCVWGLTSVRF